MPRFPDTLEIVKFIAKDLWNKLFRKSVDKLRTNNKGTYELQDNKFRWLNHLSHPQDVKETEAKVMVNLRCVRVPGLADLALKVCVFCLRAHTRRVGESGGVFQGQSHHSAREPSVCVRCRLMMAC